MISGTTIMAIIGIALIGYMGGSLIGQKKKFQSKAIKKVMKNPELLKEKLKQNTIYDQRRDGSRVKINIDDFLEGKEILEKETPEEKVAVEKIVKKKTKKRKSKKR